MASDEAVRLSSLLTFDRRRPRRRRVIFFCRGNERLPGMKTFLLDLRRKTPLRMGGEVREESRDFSREVRERQRWSRTYSIVVK